jgi:CYTH domain-containing protein
MKTTKNEIERRWLLKKFPKWLENMSSQKITIDQFYLENKEQGLIRLRKMYYSPEDKVEWVTTIKTRTSDLTNIETEQIISVTEAMKLFLNSTVLKVLSKTRNVVEYSENGRNLWLEFDATFGGIDVKFLEIEFKSEEEAKKPLTFVKDVEECIIAEVTGDHRFSNFSIAQEDKAIEILAKNEGLMHSAFFRSIFELY